MLSLDKPIGTMQGLMIWRDHADNGLFYYVAERPRIARSGGVPEFSLIKYKRDITDNPDLRDGASLGGGLLSFTVELAVDDDVVEGIKEELREFSDGSPVRMSPVQFDRGTVRLSISKQGGGTAGGAAGSGSAGGTGGSASGSEDGGGSSLTGGFQIFEEVMGASKPSLFGANRATFTVTLSREGATLVEEALGVGTSPIGVIYDLETLGMRPAFNVKVTAHYERIYRHVENHAAFRSQSNGVALAGQISTAFQELIDNGSIKVEVLNFTDDDDLKKKSEEALDWFKKELLKDFFKPALTPPAWMTSGIGPQLLTQLNTLFSGLNAAQTNQSSVPQLGNPTDAAGTSAAAPDTPAAGVQTTTQNNQTAQQHAATNEPTRLQAAFVRKELTQIERKTRVLEFSMQQAVKWNIAPQGQFATVTAGIDLRRAVREVNLDDDFFKRVVATVTLAGDLAAMGITDVAVNLDYPGGRADGRDPSHIDGWRFTPEKVGPETFVTFVNDAKDLSYRYRQEVFFGQDAPWIGKSQTHVGDWTVTRNRQLVLSPLANMALLDIRVFWGRVTEGSVEQAIVELVYEDTANDFVLKREFLMKPGDEETHLKLRLSDPNHQEFKYRVIYTLAGGLRHETPWVTTISPSVIVNEPYEGRLKVRVVPRLDPMDLVEALLDIDYAEADTGYKRREQRVYTPDNLRSEFIEIPSLAAHPENFTYELSVILADGREFNSGTVESDKSLILVAAGEGAARVVTVRLTDTNLDAAGLVAVRVAVSGPGADPDQDSVLFTPSQTAERRLFIAQPPDATEFVYTYQVTGYSAAGDPVTGAAGTERSGDLMIGLPRSG